MKTNQKIATKEFVQAAATKTLDRNKSLDRLVLANMLFEDQFYVDGKTTENVLQTEVARTSAEYVAKLAKLARTKFKLRHVPLALLVGLARTSRLKADYVANTIERADEMGELISQYWKANGKRVPLPSQLKKGLAKKFVDFNEFQLAKNDKNSAAVSMRDVMFMVHPKPQNVAQADLFKRLANDELKTPDTWEVALSAGADKKGTFTRLMADKKLGALAFLRNLRNMVEAGVEPSAIVQYGHNVNVDKVLPFRYIAARKYVGGFYHPMLESMMLRSLESMDKIRGRTALLVDVSGSMFGGHSVSGKSELERFDAAGALAMLMRNVCEHVDIYTFSDSVCLLNNPAKGFSLIDAMRNSQHHSGTALFQAAHVVSIRAKYDRFVIFTDEQDTFGYSHGGYSGLPALTATQRGYVINVAAYQHGVQNTGGWETVSGFSEAVIDYVQMVESDPFATL